MPFASISVTNFTCLVVSMWLGFYIVTRSPRSRVSWLASATLWSLCGYFLNNLTYYQGPSGEGNLPWWWGWSVVIAVPFWYHLSSHSLYDWARSSLDRLFYRQQYRELRANLREFARTTTQNHDVQNQLRAILQVLGRSLKVSQCFIALREGEGFAAVVAWQMDSAGHAVASSALAADEIVELNPSAETCGLTGMTLLIPLQTCGELIGAIVLGQTVTGGRYTKDDRDLLEDLADAVAGVVHTVRLQEQNVGRIGSLLREFRERERVLQEGMQEALAAETRSPLLEGQSERETIALVEDALRHVHDYSYLGEHELARLCMVDAHLTAQEDTFVTHLDRGKALHQVLSTAVEKLRPSGSQPSPPTREWHQYVVLHDCYVSGKLTRDVMGALYVSEGTFNRARRQAIRGVARALGEMEGQARQRIPHHTPRVVSLRYVHRV